MIASFILSRTLVPTMAVFLLRAQPVSRTEGAASAGALRRLQMQFEQRFNQFRDGYRALLARAIEQRGRFILVFLAATLTSMIVILPWLGRDFFPGIKSGEIDMHFRAPIGTRLEEAGKTAALVDAALRDLLPGQVANVIDNCGLPVSGLNQAYSASATIGPQDCDVTISLNNPASPVDEYRSILRAKLPRLFPGTAYTFPPGDITAKILNFGLPAPIDVQIIGRNTEADMAYAEHVVGKLRASPASWMRRSSRRWDSQRS